MHPVGPTHHHPLRRRGLERRPAPNLSPSQWLLIVLAVILLVLAALQGWARLRASRAPGPPTLSAAAAATASQIYIPLVDRSRATPTPTPAPTATAGAIRTYYVNGQTGSDTNAGSSAAPWRTVTKAVNTIPPGATVVIAAGLYRVSELTFGPGGVSAAALTTFRAAPNARVIFTTADDLPPTIYLRDYVRLDGLWFGGHYQNGNESTWGGFRPGGGPIGRGRQIVNCTLFGYREGIQIGSSEYLLVQDNRLVNTGHGELMHGIYLSGGEVSGSLSQHIIVDHNLFIGGEGWGLHGWHQIRSAILTRNFVAQHDYGGVLDGSDHLVANNLFWKQHGGNFSAKGFWLAGTAIRFYNNLLGPNSPISPDSNLAQNTLLTNAYLGPNTNSPGLGTGAITLTNGQEAAQLGVSAASLDSAIASLQAAFDQPVATIYANGSIEGWFATLRAAVPSGSPLYQAGTPWFGAALNIGPDAPAPASPDAFWAAFRALGLRDWDRFGSVSP